MERSGGSETFFWSFSGTREGRKKSEKSSCIKEKDSYLFTPERDGGRRASVKQKKQKHRGLMAAFDIGNRSGCGPESSLRKCHIAQEVRATVP